MVNYSTSWNLAEEDTKVVIDGALSAAAPKGIVSSNNSDDIGIDKRFAKNPAYPSGGCVVCFLGGDQVRCWAQELEVLHCDMTSEEAKLIFELYNRMYDEYNPAQNDTFYCGLENLADEVTAAREKMRREMKPGLDYGPANFEEIEEEFDDIEEDEDGYTGGASLFYRFAMSRIEAEPERYGSIEKFIQEISEQEGNEQAFREIFNSNAFDREVFYWTDYARVSEKEFDDYSAGYNHWYDIAELFGADFPFDFSDPEVVTIFGTDTFLAFADLSYGC